MHRHGKKKKKVPYIAKVISRSGSLSSRYPSQNVYIFNIVYTHSTDSVFPNNFIICLTA